MLPNVGPLEIAIVLVIALVVFGPKRLPELGRSLGKGINEFREGVSKIGEATDVDSDDSDDDSDQVELTAPAATGPEPVEPEVTELVSDEGSTQEPAPEPVDGEVVPERHD